MQMPGGISRDRTRIRDPGLMNGAYDLLERLGYSCRTPRPLHEQSDPAAIAHFKANASLL
jgi:hypothetical protein